MEFTEFDLERINGGLGTDYDFDIIVERLFGREYANYQKGLYDRVYTVEQVSDILLYSDFELTPENLLVVTNKLNEKIAREKAKLNMELDEKQLENVNAGYAANNTVERLADLLYNQALIRNETMGGGTMTLYMVSTVIRKLNEMGIVCNGEEQAVTDLLNARISEYNDKLSHGR
jgi:hypothetical protein